MQRCSISTRCPARPTPAHRSALADRSGAVILALLALAPLLGLLGCGGSGGGAATGVTDTTGAFTAPASCGGATLSFECEVIERINFARAAQSPPLPALSYEPLLALAAQSHNAWMVENGCFAHQCMGEPDVGARIAATGYAFSGYGECIAAGQGSPEAVVNAWLASPGHRAILLGSHVDVGIGFTTCAGGCAYGTYWTANFATPR